MIGDLQQKRLAMDLIHKLGVCCSRLARAAQEAHVLNMKQDQETSRYALPLSLLHVKDVEHEALQGDEGGMAGRMSSPGIAAMAT